MTHLAIGILVVASALAMLTIQVMSPKLGLSVWRVGFGHELRVVAYELDHNPPPPWLYPGDYDLPGALVQTGRLTDGRLWYVVVTIRPLLYAVLNRTALALGVRCCLLPAWRARRRRHPSPKSLESFP
ncbi:MAG: hypothetical protein C4547_05365 [Phycisphaerales bacterium]|nr:MAG: hypothetical protein C4547_05365 [Phycisphaerales bacterium]